MKNRAGFCVGQPPNTGTASGYVNNDLNHVPFFVNNTRTIYNRLEVQGKSWRIYYDSHWFLCMAFIGQSGSGGIGVGGSVGRTL